MEDQLPRYLRQEIIALVDDELITVDQIVLSDGRPDAPWVCDRLADRWTAASPMRRAAQAVMAYLEDRGVELSGVHLHGEDMDRDVSLTPYFAGFSMRYFRAARRCLTDEAGIEWIEVVRPTRRQPLRALLLRPGPQLSSSGWGWSPNSFFHSGTESELALDLGSAWRCDVLAIVLRLGES
jgi:hypothetical protein